MSQEEDVSHLPTHRLSLVEKEMIVFKQDLFELRKSQELRGSSFEYQMTAMRERIDSVMAEMKSRNNELADKFDRHLIAEEKNQISLANVLEKINNKVEDMGEEHASSRERQIYIKEQMVKLNSDISGISSTIDGNETSIEKLEKVYYTVTGAVLIVVPVIGFVMERFIS